MKMINNKNIALGILASSILRLGEGEDTIKDSPEFKAALAEVQSQNAEAIKAAVAEATGGLSTKNQELLDELKNTKGNLKQFEGLDAEKVKSLMTAMEQNEDMKLLAEGKFEDVIAKRTDKMSAEYGEKLSSLEKALEETTNNANKYKTTFEKNTISDAVRTQALKAGVLPEALDDIIRRGLDLFSIDDDGKVEARDEKGNLLTHDELLVTPERFIESLKKSAKHYWGVSSGAGAEGNKGGEGTGAGNGAGLDSVVSNDGGNFDLEAYRRKRKAMSGEGYNKKR